MSTLPRGAQNLQVAFEDLERGLVLRAVGVAPKGSPSHMTLYCMKNTGTGKHQAWIQFPTGAAVLVATEP